MDLEQYRYKYCDPKVLRSQYLPHGISSTKNMTSSIYPFLAYFLQLAAITYVSYAGQWSPLACEEITPSICNLNVKNGTMSIRSISIEYWRSKRKQQTYQVEIVKHIALCRASRSDRPHRHDDDNVEQCHQ